MRAYFDTSALVPLLIDEPSTALCTDTWNGADIIIASSLTYVEVHSAISAAVRSRRLDVGRHRRTVDHFRTIWGNVAKVAHDDAVIQHAATLTASHSLLAYDAVQCATALAVASDDFFAASGDRELLRAWESLGIPTIDTHAHA